MKVLRDRLLVEREAGPRMSKGGVVLPERSSESGPSFGIVRYAGPGRLLETGVTVPMSTKVGDRVFFSGYNDTAVEIDGVALLCMRDDDVIGIVD